MNKIIIVFLVLLIGIFSFSKFPKSENSDDVIIVGTNAEYPPFTFIDDGKIIGFDIDIITEVVERLNKKMELKDMPFDALIPDLQMGNVQVVAAGMCSTEERKKRILFSSPYASADSLVILTLKENEISNVDDLIGKVVVVNEGFTADTFISSKEGIDVIRLATIHDGFLALKSKRASAFITAQSTVENFLASQHRELYSVSIIETTKEHYALAISKKAKDLLVDIQHALDEMEKDGTTNKIKNKWNIK